MRKRTSICEDYEKMVIFKAAKIFSDFTNVQSILEVYPYVLVSDRNDRINDVCVPLAGVKVCEIC